ncbi:MAG: 50S ribosomal protein L16 [Candidatus Brocadiaceae bacterium]
MPLMPKRVKHRKFQRGRLKGKATRGNRVAFGEYGLQALERGRLTAEQLEAGRLAVMHFLRREGKLVTRVFPHRSTTATPTETRMGKGKGEVSHWVAHVKPGTVLYELSGVSEELARAAFSRVAHKMPIKTRFLHRKVRA